MASPGAAAVTRTRRILLEQMVSSAAESRSVSVRYTSLRLDPVFPKLYTKFWPNSDGAGMGLPAYVRRPGDPGPRSSGDQGIYRACLPARNIRPSHSPSTWARPAPPRRLGQATSCERQRPAPSNQLGLLVRPIIPGRCAHRGVTHARPNRARAHRPVLQPPATPPTHNCVS